MDEGIKDEAKGGFVSGMEAQSRNATMFTGCVTLILLILARKATLEEAC